MNAIKQDTKINSALSSSANALFADFISSYEFDDFMPDRRLRLSSCNFGANSQRIGIKSQAAKPKRF